MPGSSPISPCLRASVVKEPGEVPVEMKCPNDGTEMVEGTQIGGGMTFAYIAPPESAGGQKTIWLYTKVCPQCGLVQTYIKEPEIYQQKW